MKPENAWIAVRSVCGDRSLRAVVAGDAPDGGLDARVVVDHLIEADALVVDRGGQREGLDGVRGLLALGGLDRIARVAVGARDRLIVGRHGVQLEQPQRRVDAVALLDVLEVGVQANQVVRGAVQVQRDGVVVEAVGSARGRPG